MIDEKTGGKYPRATGKKGTRHGGELDWRIQHMVDELQSWGNTGEAGGHFILKNDDDEQMESKHEKMHKGNVSSSYFSLAIEACG